MSKTPNPKWTTVEIERLHGMLDKGMTLTAAAAALGRTRHGASKILNRIGAPKRRSACRPITTDELDRLDAMLDDGMTLTEAAAAIGRRLDVCSAAWKAAARGLDLRAKRTTEVAPELEADEMRAQSERFIRDLRRHHPERYIGGEI